jgi:hypothetical protein
VTTRNSSTQVIPHRSRQRSFVRGLVALVAATVSLSLVAAGPALGYNDSFAVVAKYGCGMATFVDYGPGASGGGPNDDYMEVMDTCSDHHGVKAYTWVNGNFLGSKYNGNGSGSLVVWDPFDGALLRARGNDVVANDLVGVKICLVDGNSDPTPFNCSSWSQRSRDG